MTTAFAHASSPIITGRDAYGTTGRRRKKKYTNNLSRRAVVGGKLIPNTHYDNTVDAFNVQLWAQESLSILVENMVMGMLVHRDFDNVIANYGDTVNVRKPGEFNAKRKTNADAVTIQNVTATSIPVKLNQHVHVTYLIKDGEETISFTSIIDEFLRPAMIAKARFVDHVLSCQVYQFLANSAGRLRNLTTSNAKSSVLALRGAMNRNNAWVADRNLVLTSETETALLELDAFTDADRVGDDGTALRNAALGRKFGFDILMAQNQPYVDHSLQTSVLITGAINNAAGYPAGSTSFAVDGLSAAITAGTWLTIAGDDTPLQVVSTTGGATPTAIVTATGLKTAVVDNAVITLYPKGTVSGTYTYDSTTNTGYAKEITISGLTVAPQVGQLVSFGSDTTKRYGVIEVNGLVGVTLDRPLEATVSNGATINLGPSGSYNFAFHPNALTMVTRPLVQPRQGTGALSAVVPWMGMSVRVTITYDGNKQGHLVTLDMLMGVKVLDEALGAVLYG
jgi:hypothetical protein